MQTFWNREAETVIGQCCLCFSVIRFNQHQQFTEDFTHVSSVNLINDKEVILIWMVCCFLTEPIENTIFQFKTVLDWLITHHEIFIGIVLMELHKLDAVIIFLTHNRISQTLSCISLSDTGCSLKDDVFLLCENSYKTVIFCLGHINLF